MAKPPGARVLGETGAQSNIVGSLIGVVSGCVLGVLALVASRIFRPKTAPNPPAV